MTGQLASQSEARRAEAEEDLVKLAIAIARRVLHRELATDPDAILGLVKAAAAKLNARDVRRLRLSPNYYAVVAAHRAALELSPGLHVESDESLGSDSIIFETVRGELDATVGTQLAEIERGLTDLVRRKSHGGNRSDA
jgi:flagellar assembly protein FliH